MPTAHKLLLLCRKMSQFLATFVASNCVDFKLFDAKHKKSLYLASFYVLLSLWGGQRKCYVLESRCIPPAHTNWKRQMKVDNSKTFDLSTKPISLIAFQNFSIGQFIPPTILYISFLYSLNNNYPAFLIWANTLKAFIQNFQWTHLYI